VRAFVTGSTGLLGNNLVRTLLQAGHEVWALARSKEKARRANRQRLCSADHGSSLPRRSGYAQAASKWMDGRILRSACGGGYQGRLRHGSIEGQRFMQGGV
jgi:nucleoside-diphosphate-sugar epimerase